MAFILAGNQTYRNLLKTNPFDYRFNSLMSRDYPIQTAFVVDDNEVDLFIQKRFMEMSHFANEIITFSSPGRALAAIQSDSNQPPGVIFLDLNMPMINGFEFLEALQLDSSNGLNQLKVVILTSSNNQADYERAHAYKNVIGFISKPLTQQRLDELVKRIKPDVAPG